MEPGKAHAFHKHPTREELLYVLSGRAEQWVGKEHRILGPGEVAFVHGRGSWHLQPISRKTGLPGDSLASRTSRARDCRCFPGRTMALAAPLLAPNHLNQEVRVVYCRSLSLVVHPLSSINSAAFCFCSTPSRTCSACWRVKPNCRQAARFRSSRSHLARMSPLGTWAGPSSRWPISWTMA